MQTVDKDERMKKLVSLCSQLTRFTCIVKHISFRKDLCRFILQKQQGLMQRPNRHPADRHCVELLETVDRARHSAVAKRSYRT